MSDDFINQLTLRFLINKTQLKKLNKITKENKNQIKIEESEHYSERIKTLVSDLLVYNIPTDLLYEVKSSFDEFVDKSIYYFKAHDNGIHLETERNSYKIYDDIDFEKEERAIENGNYKEHDQEDEDQEDEDQEDEDQEDEDQEDDKEKDFL
jgi:hypothetical protein